MNYKLKIILGVVVTVFVLVGSGIYYQIKQEEAKQTLNGTNTAAAQKKDKTIVEDDSQHILKENLKSNILTSKKKN